MKEEEIKKSGPEDCFFSLPAQLDNVIYLNFLKDEKHHAWTKKVTPKVMVLKSLKHHISKRNISAFDQTFRSAQTVLWGEINQGSTKIMWLQDAFHFNLHHSLLLY